jgi:hypothetical protein
MKKLCLAGAALALLIGTGTYDFAQGSDSSQKMSPGHHMLKRGSSPGTSGNAPGHQNGNDRGTLRDSDDRMMNHDRD